MFLLCKLNFVKQFFFNCLGEHLILKYLGPNGGISKLIEIVVLILATVVADVYLAEIKLSRIINSIIKNFCERYSRNLQNWCNEVKAEYINLYLKTQQNTIRSLSNAI
jgi:hypothetical protein